MDEGRIARAQDEASQNARDAETDPPAGVTGIVSLLGGLFFVAVGAWFATGSLGLPLGTVTHMGPGYFPLSLAVIIMVLGLLIAVQDFRQRMVVPTVDWRPLALVSASILGFAFGIRYLGLVPAIVLTVLISSLAASPLRMGGALVLAVVLSLVAWLIFTLGLGLALPPFRFAF